VTRPRTLVAMSGGVDSSVAAALLLEQGHEVVGVTMKLWGGAQDSGCCSVADVDDARRVAQQLGIDHYVFNFGDDFQREVVQPYVDDHAAGRTPNPCIECNRHLKFDRLLRRADQLGFDAVATGHHARVVRSGHRWRLVRGADTGKDQSYVLHVLGQAELARSLFPVGHLTKNEVRVRADALGLRTAGKPDSQDVCFITATGGRGAFLTERVDFHRGRVVDRDGVERGAVDAVELVTVGQRRNLGIAGGGEPLFAIDVDVPGRRVTVGSAADLLTEVQPVVGLSWVGEPVTGEVDVQTSAHGAARPAVFDGRAVRWVEPQRRVAPGQSVVLYRSDDVVGGGIAA
jgi:tRNA-uridine 2-sulfurtransferase